jgi:RimJ/RimL family protein N-acetyltransferase
MPHPYWPLFDLVVRTPRLEIRYPDDDRLMELAAVAVKGIHDPGFMPFLQPWTRAESPEFERNALKHWWTQRSRWDPEEWHFTGAVIVDGRAVGVQDVGSTHFAVTRAVSTGSWLGRQFHGQGIGKEMRAAILHLAFAGLDAVVAYSGAFEGNAASLGVSRALGYVENGEKIHDSEGQRVREIGLKLTREAWETRRRDDITITGLEACREWFGAPAGAD